MELRGPAFRQPSVSHAVKQANPCGRHVRIRCGVQHLDISQVGWSDGRATPRRQIWGAAYPSRRSPASRSGTGVLL